MSSMIERLKKGWNAFLGRDPTIRYDYGIYGSPPSRHRMSVANTRNVVNSIFNKIAVAVSGIDIKHVMVDENDKYVDTINSPLNELLSVESNIDQTGREFIRDAVMSMFDEGCVALVPIDTDHDPLKTDSYNVYSARVGKVIEWFHDSIKLEVWRSEYQRKEEIILPKRVVPIIENPFYSIMNEPNSILQRLIRLMNQLDRLNDENTSGKLDLIIQLPYVIRSEEKRRQAEKRRKDIEVQLTGSKYGIAYTDATERIIQLNRSIENTIWTQVKDLQTQLFNYFGLTPKVLDGTADEKEMLNYYNNTIEPIVSAFTENIKRKWLSRNARSRGQSIKYFRDPFKLIPANDLAEIADKFTRNEIMTSNEIRAIIGLKPSDDPRANELRNSNLNHPDENGKTEVVDEKIDENSK